MATTERHMAKNGRKKPISAGRVDWDRLRATTDQEIAEQIAADPDTAPNSEDATGWRVRRNPPVPDVGSIRERLGLSQARFAARYGLSVRTVQEWEQGRAVPDQPARVLLRLIEREPETVARMLEAS